MVPGTMVPTVTTIKNLRETRELTQQALAAKAGISLRQIQNIERGHASPRVTTALALARALGVSLDQLFPEKAAS